MSALTAPTNGGPPLLEREEGLFEELMGRVPEIREELDALDQQHHMLTASYQAEVEALNAKKKTLNNLLKALGHESPAKPRGRPRATAPAGASVSAPIILQIIEAIEKMDDDQYFTVLSIHNEVGANWSTAQSYQAFKYLRDTEFIGKVSTETGSTRVTFRILYRHVGEELKQRLAAEERARPKPVRIPTKLRPPTAESLQRHVEAIKTLGGETTVLDVARHLDLSSPKNSYGVFRYMAATEMVEKAGETAGAHPRERRTIYRLLKETPDAV